MYEKRGMNLFNSTAQFRRGKVLEDPAVTASVVLGGGEGDSDDAQPTASPPQLSHPPPSKRTDLATLLATAQDQRRPQHRQQSAGVATAAPQRRLFPPTPYYGLLSHCEVHLDVALTDDDNDGGDDDNGETTAAAGGVAPHYNPPSTISRLAHMQHLLNACAQTHGAVYYLGTAASPYFSSASSSTPLASSSALTYAAYVEAMQDGFGQMMQLRASLVRSSSTSLSPSPTTPTTQHCFYMQLVAHPQWKDLGLLLCVEQARLLLCLLSSSRVTQKHLTSVCAEVGVELEWLSGASLVVEPAALAAAAFNPIWAAWDALLHLPLLPLQPSNGGSTTDGVAAVDVRAVNNVNVNDNDNSNNSKSSDVSAGVREALAVVQGASLPLQGGHLTLVSSLAFRGALRCSPVGRFTEEAAVFAYGDDNDNDDGGATLPTAPAAGQAPQSSSATTSRPRRPVARRFIWSVLPSQAWLLPHFMTRLLRCLIDECGLRSFTLRCASPCTDAVVHVPGATAVRDDGGNATVSVMQKKAAGVAGVRIVRGDAPSVLPLRQGPSTVSWIAFSRLSGGAWVDAETREGLELGREGHRDSGDADNEDDEEDEREVEFELKAIQYVRSRAASATTAPSPSSQAVLLKRPRGTSHCDRKCTWAEDESAHCVCTEAWGPSFTFIVSVNRAIVFADFEN